MTTPLTKVPLSPPSGSLHVWAGQLYRWLIADYAAKQAPAPLKPAWLQAGDNPSQDGIVMYDPANQCLVVSISGAWVQLAVVP